MTLILALLLAADTGKTIEVRRAATPPRIDGRVDEVWQTADSIDDFVQHWPDEEAAPTERTVVRVLQDDGNFYVLFRCYATRHRPVGQLYGMEEEATVYIDPMNSKSNAYFFKVYGSGLWRQGMILDNGASEDWSWECVWEGTSRLSAGEFTAEMKIPFKSIRYQAGANEWGVNFHRFIAVNQEQDFWIAKPEREGGVQVSDAGQLQGIEPKAKGYYFELFPEGYMRYDQAATDTVETAKDVLERIRPRASLNLKWDLTPQTTLNATALPDFAQIESDPYSFNISRYPTYLSERRPFFVEGSEVFRMTSQNGHFSPLNIFYSRRIGKPVAGEPVPILGGLKLTTRSGNSSFGALGAWTDEMVGTDGVVLEPRRGFAALSGKMRLADASNLGLLASGTAADAENYNYALGSDWNFSRGGNRGVVQAALSDKDGKLGWAMSSGYFGYVGRGVMSANMQVISDSFSVDDIGYVPWAGRTRFDVSAGPLFTPRSGALRRLTVTPGIVFGQELGTKNPSYGILASANPNFRNGWGGYAEGFAGHAEEAGLGYFGRSASFSVWGNGLTYNANIGGGYDYSYNYQRGFLAANYSDWLGCTYYVAGRVALMLSANNWWECDPQGSVVAVTSVARPKIDFRINSRVAFNVYDELVFSTPDLRLAESRLVSNRVGFLFSWNFMPKSWFFLAFNDLGTDRGEGLQLSSRVGAVKLRYLFYF